jgi:hypothetical protein
MSVVNSRINDRNIDTFTLDAGSVEFINTGHGVYRVVDARSLLTPGSLGDQRRQYESMGGPNIGNANVGGLQRVEVVFLDLNGSTSKDVILKDSQNLQARLVGQAIGGNSSIGVL